MVMASGTGNSRNGIKGNGWKMGFAYLCFVKLFWLVIVLCAQTDDQSINWFICMTAQKLD